ncbi:MAG: excinuclease ABC subunit UvrA [Bacteroidia bacterium]|nr:excinuclease ABC subunit UvrA [Bacteroidia bacterium]
MAEEFIEIWGAREHNLDNVDLKIPRDQLTVITGVSGSGKSSIAFDTIFAEGQRRYLESFSAYARQFIGDLRAPEVDKIDGLSPVIAIEQKTTSRNPRSTVGTVTEIYDLFRLLYARIADAYSHVSGKKMVKMSDQQIIKAIEKNYFGKKIIVLAPLVKGRKGHYRELFENLTRQGFTKVRVDGKIEEIQRGLKLDRYKVHDIELVVDRILAGSDVKRMEDSIALAMNFGEGSMLVMDHETEEVNWFSRSLMDPEGNISYDEPSPNTFSFNSPYGACPKCNGLGYIYEVDLETVVPNENLSINHGGIAPIGEFRDIWIFRQLRKIATLYDFSMATPWKDIPEEAKELILYGEEGKNVNFAKIKALKFDGIFNFIRGQYHQSSSEKIKAWAENFMSIFNCPECLGERLKLESRHFRLADKNISQVSALDMVALKEWVESLGEHLSERQAVIGHEVIREITKRIDFLLEVGLDYLSLDRPAKSLSGGEAQRIRLATQIGSQLVGVLYILDEPSIGLHQRDNQKLINSLLSLRDLGNTVIVVEHDKDMMLASDYIIDFGPGAGIHGGKVVAEGNPKEILSSSSSTAAYLSGAKEIAVPKKRRPKGEFSLVLKGATGNNLKSVDLHLPLGLFVCVTGVSGSGKSTLINETLYPILHAHFYKTRQKPMPYESIEGLEHVTKVIDIDQSPIGRTPRSNAATYTGLFTHIRDFFTQTNEAKIRGYQAGRFSFNVKGGRCEDCQGGGVKTIEMNFLPDVYVTCDTCQGRRYNRETLEVRYKGKSISDVLNMTVEDALEYFEAHPRIKAKLKTLADVGLGYITLGQSATTLSGGEAQRVKIATELSKKDTGSTIYILDEPTTGLHFRDIEMLLQVLNRLVKRGNTVIVIEHNLDVIKVADWVIDVGPEGGFRGGQIIAEGTPEEIAAHPLSFTGKFLAPELGMKEKI